MNNLAQPHPYKILVVDDEPDLEPLVKQRMRRQIRAKRYEFVFAHNGVEALEVLRKVSDIDMVLSDINMPRMDGLTLLGQISEIDPDMRAVIISAYGDMKNIRTAMNRGAFDFVTKPIDFTDLTLTIDRTLTHMAKWREALSTRDKLVALQNELNVASSIQQSILPTDFPKGDDFEIFGNMEPARNVGGDFFDIILLDSGKIGLAVADVSDKGVPAALFMMSSRTLLKYAANTYQEPRDVLREVNDVLTEDNDAAMFVTMLYAVYDPRTGNLTYANGGHNTPIIVHPDGSATQIPLTGGIALGVMDELEYEQKTVTIEPGDTLIMYTDGVTEAMNIDGEEFGMERLCNLFADAPPTNLHESNSALFSAISDFEGDAPQSDDITCMMVRRSEK